MTKPTQADSEPGFAVEIALDDGARLQGRLSVPPHPRGLVVFAHGHGTGLSCPRNRAVSAALLERHLATLRVDLITEEEDEEASEPGQTKLLAHRLVETTGWVREHPLCAGLPIGYFGAGTRALAAFEAAAVLHRTVKAVVALGVPPLHADRAMEEVVAPTLLLVNGADPAAVGVGEELLAELRGVRELAAVPRVTHLFDEVGALDLVSVRARDWFLWHLTGVEAAGARAP